MSVPAGVEIQGVVQDGGDRRDGRARRVCELVEEEPDARGQMLPIRGRDDLWERLGRIGLRRGAREMRAGG